MSPKGGRHEVLKIALNRHWPKLCPENSRSLRKPPSASPSTPIWSPISWSIPVTVGLAGIKGENVFLVVEVADTSLRYDRGRKAKLYAQFGVRELWAIDAVKMTTRVFRAPSVEGYGEVNDFKASDATAPLFAPNDFALRLDRLKLV